MQLLISGKAHPLDTPGKEIIKRIVTLASQDRFRSRIIFLEDYDINVARYLVQGSDVWLNNPRRPQEASGTSGMKAALNGALNFSTLDGWWDEAYDDKVGFKIGHGAEYENLEMQDHLDAEMLYSSLEREVLPLFYERDEMGIPVRWIAKMKNAIHMAGEQFSTHRMLMDYTDHYYHRAFTLSARMRSEDFKRTRILTSWTQRMDSSWDKIAIKNVEIPELGPTLYVGQKFPIKIKVALGQLTPEDVDVEIVSGRLDSQEHILDYKPITATLNDGETEDGVYTYAGVVVCRESGRFGITARIVPRNDDLPHTIRPRLISWW